MKHKETAGNPISIKEQLDKVEASCQLKTKHPIEIAFAIPLKSKAVSHDWTRVQASLSKTLRSILGSTDQQFRILIAGHEKPQIAELNNERVTWLPVDCPPPTDSNGFSKDRGHKRRAIGAYLRKSGFSGYFMPLDADDWIHYRFVEFIRSRPRSDAFVLNNGFMVNENRQEVWMRDRFYRGCGSSAAYYFANHDFPLTSRKEDSQNTLFGMVVKSHQDVIQHLEQYNKDYILVELPLATYVLAHGDNWTFTIGNLDNEVSAKNYRAKGEKLRDWYYDYFKIK
ncbi:MAG: hypothetical protein WD424_05020 [Paenibacillaceae bacterium]